MLADDGAEILEHILLDRLVKIAIVLVALALLGIGMTVIWRVTGRDRRPPGAD